MKILFETITGSTAYGCNTLESDIDKKSIFIQSNDEILGFKYKDRIEVSKDHSMYEIKRFLELLQTANPTMLEILYSPKECILKDSPQFNLILKNKEKFLTKKCEMAFAGYAISQIKKSKGLNKKMNWDKSKTIRKTPFDFCFIYEDGKTIDLNKWLKKEKKIQDHCGLSKLNNFKDCYALYYDYKAQYADEAYNRGYKKEGFRGIANEDSNELILSGIPEYMKDEAILYYNQEEYSKHCREYKEYKEWIENRNEQRYLESQSHGQNIDGKNLMHCRRLLDMAIEIAKHGILTVKRENAEELLKIRKGEINLNDFIKQCEKDFEELKELYEKSNLSKEVDSEFVNQLLVSIRKM
jgi:predicted nucleotidyltransferase